ncbi:hypothetical protein MMC29_006843 [Sticta canariensis]|nr:hypothetical protein [Sticta canariensis]
MSQHPSPDVTARSFSRAATASSQRSTASVHETDYREKLEQYNNYGRGGTLPPGYRPEVENMLRETMKGLQNKGEEEVRNRLGAHVIPGYIIPSDKRLEVVHDQLWNKAIAVPSDLSHIEPPLPLPKPKSDTTFAVSKAAFDRFELATMKQRLIHQSKRYGLYQSFFNF